MHPSFKTPLTQVLGCNYPVIQTAMGWVSTSQLVTATVEAGAFGFLAAAVMTPQDCEKEIQFIKSKTTKPFGVNIHAFQPDVDKIVDMCIDYGVTGTFIRQRAIRKNYREGKKRGTKMCSNNWLKSAC